MNANTIDFLNNIDFENSDIVYEEMKKLFEENQELKNNWAAIKEYCLNEQIPEEYDEYNSYIEFSNNAYEKVLNKMQEMESNNANTTN